MPSWCGEEQLYPYLYLYGQTAPHASVIHTSHVVAITCAREVTQIKIKDNGKYKAVPVKTMKAQMGRQWYNAIQS